MHCTRLHISALAASQLKSREPNGNMPQGNEGKMLKGHLIPPTYWTDDSVRSRRPRPKDIHWMHHDASRAQ